MNRSSPSVAHEEVARFSAQAGQWWQADGPFSALHKLGPVRLNYIEEQIAALMNRKPPYKGLRILDVGCGGGLIAEDLAAQGARVVGLDASIETIEVAKAHAAEQGLAIDYRIGSVEELARGKERFDVITAFEIVEHVADLKSFMAALTKLLKPQGIVIVATLNRTTRSFLFGVVAAEYVLGWVPEGTHDWDSFVKPSELASLWATGGVTPVDLTGLVYRPLLKSFEISKQNVAVNYFMTGRKEITP